jgi:hypothetical protein
MKKVFWTSIVWIILICGFTLYMKWFNQPLAQKVTAFVYPGEECPVLQRDVPVCEESEPTECECPACEVAECNCPTQMVTDADVFTKVFDQLDKIEKKLSGTTTEKSEEELFEEFKTWYESKE